MKKDVPIRAKNLRTRAKILSVIPLVQLGQASASLGEADLAYRCLVPLPNRFLNENLPAGGRTR